VALGFYNLIVSWFCGFWILGFGRLGEANNEKLKYK
jgi:hypothetical protein